MFEGVAAGLVVLMGDVSSMLGVYSLVRASGETVAILGLFRLRRKFPASADTYVVRGSCHLQLDRWASGPVDEIQ